MVIAAYSGRQRSFIRKQTVGVFYGQQKNNIFSSIFNLVPKIEREEARKDLDYSPHPAVICE